MRQTQLKELHQKIIKKRPKGNKYCLPHTHSPLTTHTPSADVDPTDLKKYRKLQRISNRPNKQLISDLKAWCERKKNFTLFGAPWQADAQMLYLQFKFRSWITGIIRFVCWVSVSYVSMCYVPGPCVFVYTCYEVRTVMCGRWEPRTGTRVTLHGQEISTDMWSGTIPKSAPLGKWRHLRGTPSCLFVIWLTHSPDPMCACMCARRIRFTMWTGNDFLPSFEGVGWTTAKKLHQEYENLPDDEAKVRTQWR